MAAATTTAAAAGAAAAQSPAPTTTGHRRNRSAVLRSFISSRGHRRSPTEGSAIPYTPVSASPPFLPAPSLQPPLLPPDHPHSASQSSPRKSNDNRSTSTKKSLHKKSLSSVSLRSLAKRADDKPKEKKSSDLRRSQDEPEKSPRPKSSTNLAAMFSKAKSRDRSPTKESRDKENTEPSRAAYAPPPPPTPIWAEFSSQSAMPAASNTPLDSRPRTSTEGGLGRFPPADYSPTKQRNFFEYGQPAVRNPATKQRPKSMFAASSSTTSLLLDTFSRKRSNERMPLSDTQGNEGRFRDPSPSKSKSTRPALGRASTDSGSKDFSVKPMAPPPPPASPKKQNRVMAAVAAFNGKAKQADGPPTPTVKHDPKVVDAEFEEVLVSLVTSPTCSCAHLRRNREISLPTNVRR